MLVEQEQEVMLFPERNPNKPADAPKSMSITVATAGSGKPALDTAGSTGALEPARALATGQAVMGSGPPSRGYREEMEDFAYCIRLWDSGISYAKKTEKGKEDEYVQRLPRCHGEVAMADAILAHVANMAMKNKVRIEFEDNWFKAESGDNPEEKYGGPKTA